MKIYFNHKYSFVLSLFCSQLFLHGVSACSPKESTSSSEDANTNKDSSTNPNDAKSDGTTSQADSLLEDADATQNADTSQDTNPPDSNDTGTTNPSITAKITFPAAPIAIEPGQSLGFRGECQGDLAQPKWSFDGVAADSTMLTSTVKFQHAGIYTIKLQCSNAQGSSAPVEIQVGVRARVVTGFRHTCAFTTNDLDSPVKCWGRTKFWDWFTPSENVGDAMNEMGANLPELTVSTSSVKKFRMLAASTDAYSLTSPYQHLCALARVTEGTQTKDRMYCWGNNQFGQLGTGDSSTLDPSQAVPVLLTATDAQSIRTIVAGSYISGVLLTNGQLKLWGMGDFRGINRPIPTTTTPALMGSDLETVTFTTNPKPYLKALAFSGGSLFSCSILEGNIAKCWGLNKYKSTDPDIGRLGDGTKLSYGQRSFWTDSPPVLTTMGDNAPNSINFGTEGGMSLYPVQIVNGEHFGCALLNNQKVKCWGKGEFLGLSDTNSRGYDPIQMGDNLPFSDSGETFTMLAANYLIKTDGTKSAMTCGILASGAPGNVACWGGAAVMGKVPAQSLGMKKLKAIYSGAGTRHFCATFGDSLVTSTSTQDLSLKCWGKNDNGQLGLGDANDRDISPGLTDVQLN